MAHLCGQKEGKRAKKAATATLALPMALYRLLSLFFLAGGGEDQSTDGPRPLVNHGEADGRSHYGGGAHLCAAPNKRSSDLPVIPGDETE